MIKIVKYEPSHLENFTPKYCHKSELVQINTEAVTFMRDGVPIAIFGGYLLFPGCLQVWGLVSEEIHKTPIAFFKSAKLLLEYYIDTLKLRRVQINVRTDYPEGWRWAVALGFKSEGVMTKFGTDGSDHWLFARTQ